MRRLKPLHVILSMLALPLLFIGIAALLLPATRGASGEGGHVPHLPRGAAASQFHLLPRNLLP
ncbi:hypothetical protein [Luteimonas sp. e5]